MSAIAHSALKSSKPPIYPKEFNDNQPRTVRLYPLPNYTFSTKPEQPEEDNSVQARLRRLQDHYDQHGMRRTCEGVLVCHEYNHLHVLLLQIANAFYKLPGDYLDPADDEVPGFKRKLSDRLSPTIPTDPTTTSDEWEVADCLAQWWRPNFETFMYPFLPPHITRPKECKKLYLMQLPQEKVLAVPKNMKLLAVPLYELYEQSQKYGPQLAAIPHYLSRFNFEYVDGKGNVVAVTPGGGPYNPVTSIPMQIDQLRVSNGVESDGHGEANGQAQNDEMPIENDNDRIV